MKLPCRFYFEPYKGGQYITKITWYRAFGLFGVKFDASGNPLGFESFGDMDGAAISFMMDGLSEEGYFADAKLFASYAWSKTRPDAGKAILGSLKSEIGTPWWASVPLPVTQEGGEFGIEYNRRYDVYDIYPIYKTSVICEVSKLHPEAGAFAPCSAYIYKKKGDDTVYMAFPNVYKWMAH